MKSQKKLGIWMDHSFAHLTEITKDSVVTNTIESKPKTQVNEADLYYKDESHSLNKEQSKLSDYYSRIGDVIKDYDEVLLFGPTSAKTELVNTLKEDHHFDNVKIEVKPADKMTENQQQAFVKEHFNA
jgi:stalled ribosome rescue protein Dom34